MTRVSNEQKNLNRLAGKFSLRHGLHNAASWSRFNGVRPSAMTLVFDKGGNVAFLEVKSSAKYSRRRYSTEKTPRPKKTLSLLAPISAVSISNGELAADVLSFPAAVVAKAAHYFFRQQVPEQR